jgi:hypothetical protein
LATALSNASSSLAGTFSWPSIETAGTFSCNMNDLCILNKFLKLVIFQLY